MPYDNTQKLKRIFPILILKCGKFFKNFDSLWNTLNWITASTFDRRFFTLGELTPLHSFIKQRSCLGQQASSYGIPNLDICLRLSKLACLFRRNGYRVRQWRGHQLSPDPWVLWDVCQPDYYSSPMICNAILVGNVPLSIVPCSNDTLLAASGSVAGCWSCDLIIIWSCRGSASVQLDISPVTLWQWPADHRRSVPAVSLPSW